MQATRTNRAATKIKGARSVRGLLMAELQREEIVNRIKQARLEAGLTQPELAELLEVAMRTYQNYEYDRVPWGLMNQIAKTTGKTTEWLLHGEPPATPDLMGTLGGGRSQLARIEAKLDALMAALDVALPQTDQPLEMEQALEVGDQPDEQPLDSSAADDEPPAREDQAS
jgi:transcriptional regulator with XRE-family HTH domain